MSDIIVTTPKNQMQNAEHEAADAIENGGGTYFRRFFAAINISPGDRVYYVEDGFVRGYAVVSETLESDGMCCDTTGRRWPAGFFVMMDATTWKWIKPIPMRGFQGYRVAHDPVYGPDVLLVGGGKYAKVEIVGGWLDPKPETPTPPLFERSVVA